MFQNPVLKKILFCAACALSGWVAAFAMPQVSFWPCLFAGLSFLYVLYARTSGAGGAFAAGFFFALGYFVTGLWWIGNALLVEGNEFAWVWPISVIGLPTLLALFTGTFLANARMMADPRTGSGFAAFALMLTLSEWARGNAFTGFPWNLYGYVWLDHLPMAQAAHFIGAYGLTILSVIWSSAAGFLFIATMNRKNKVAAGIVCLLSLGLTWFLGQMRLDRTPMAFDKKNMVVVAQPNIPQDMKWDPVEIQTNFLKIVSLSRSAALPDNPPPENVFIVWPETAISPTVYTVRENMDRMRQMLESYAGVNSYLVTGVLRRDTQDPDNISYANSVIYLNKQLSALEIYDKYHLVPFGEFIPFQKWIPLRPVAAFKGFKRGTGATTIERSGTPAFSPLICYEVIFPDEVVNKFQPRPRWIVNVTNDGWYGDSAGPHQHFAQTRLRAIEEGLPVVRSANTGVSGVIDPLGRVVEKIEIFQEGTIVSRLPLPLENRYPFWPWSVQVILFVAGLATLCLTLISRLRKTANTKG